VAFDFQSHHPDIAVDLVKGKERMYIKHFYDRLGNKAEVFTPEVLDFYEQVYSMPDAMRCSFLSYRAFEQDKRDNLEWKEKGKSKVRCCVLSGEKSFLGTAAKDMGYEFYENLEVRTVEGSGHWCAEENPKGFVKEILGFIEADAS
jgi:pimeloyl-ACP methyl ester carboxylesterase